MRPLGKRAAFLEIYANKFDVIANTHEKAGPGSKFVGFMLKIFAGERKSDIRVNKFAYIHSIISFAAAHVTSELKL